MCAHRGSAVSDSACPGSVDVTFGGGEANVCGSLALLGRPVRYLTALPEHAMADALIGWQRNLGIDTNHILRREGRLGVYYLETGANQRSSTVIYDRAASSVALAGPDEYDFDAALDGVTRVHVTGITPAISENGFLATRELVTQAAERGAKVSCDLNFRKKLWNWREGTAPKDLAQECMTQLLPLIDVVIGNEADAEDVLGIEAEGTAVEEGQINAEAYTEVARKISGRFENVSLVAITLRESLSASHNNWGAMLFRRQERPTPTSPLSTIRGSTSPSKSATSSIASAVATPLQPGCCMLSTATPMASPRTRSASPWPPVASNTRCRGT